MAPPGSGALERTGYYEVLDLRYKSGSPAVLRHTDGSGFAYYPSGRKAICTLAHGSDNRGKTRRFSAVIHADDSAGTIVGTFDEWGKGHARAERSRTDTQAPEVLFADRELTVIDGTGGVSTAPRGGAGTAGTDVHLRLNKCIMLQHKQGRTTLDFQCMSVAHSFPIGELLGEEVAGMTLTQPTSLAEQTLKEFGEVTQKLDGVRSQISTLKVDVTQKSMARTAPVALKTANLQELMDSLSNLERSLSHPNLAPAKMEWKTEHNLKQMLGAVHPQCPGHALHKSWSIGKVSGRCTDARLANTKPTVTTPKSLAMVSQLKLPELIDECASRDTLLVVVCLASFAQEPSAYAKLLAEKAKAELAKRCKSPLADGSRPQVRMVAIELSESPTLAKQYGIREVPYCLMFQDRNCVYSKRLSANKVSLRDTYMARPRVLLVEPSPAFQLKVERTLRRNGYESDLALDGPHALRLASASKEQPYGVLLVSVLLPPEQLKAIAAAIYRQNKDALIIAYNVSVIRGQEFELCKPFLDGCSHTFTCLPSYTGLAAVLSRHDNAQPVYKHVGHSKEEFVDEILGVLAHGGSGSLRRDAERAWADVRVTSPGTHRVAVKA